MKNIFLLVAFCSSVFSCGEPSTNNSVTSDIVADEIQSPQQNDFPEMAINVAYPFGCTELLNLRYPKKWEADPKNYGHLKEPEGRLFDSLYSCFTVINKFHNSSISPDIKELKFINPDANAKYVDQLPFTEQLPDSLKFRLPDIGGYQCYYFYQELKTQYGELGYVLLFDPKLKTGKAINVFHLLAGDQHIKLRWFVMTEKSIRLYDGNIYDDGNSLNISSEITFDAQGQPVFAPL